MNRSVLLVDDEQRVLDGLRRLLRTHFDLTTATSGADALLLVEGSLADAAPFAVIVSDMQMPGMDGVSFLSRAHAISPDSVQMILSGQADLGTTIAAVNDGNLFRFLTKPCEADLLAQTIDDALRQYQLVTAEKELIERTLNGAVEVLTELMASASPIAFARTSRVRALADAMVEAVRPADVAELRLASMLSQIGCVAVPGEILDRVSAGAAVSSAERVLFAGHPRLAQEMLRRIPRLERVADWIGDQSTDVDDAHCPPIPKDSPLDGWPGDLVFSIMMAYLAGTSSGRSTSEVRRSIAQAGYPDPLITAVLKGGASLDLRRASRLVTSRELTTGMILDQDIVTSGGLTLLRAGEPVTRSLAIRLRHFANTVGLIEPIAVLIEQVASPFAAEPPR